MHRNVTPSTMARDAAPRRPLIEMPAHLEAMIHSKPRRMVRQQTDRVMVAQEAQEAIFRARRWERAVEEEAKRAAKLLAENERLKHELRQAKLFERFGPRAFIGDDKKFKRGHTGLVCKLFAHMTGCTLDALQGKRRYNEIAEPRQRLMWILASNGPYSLPQIGRYLNRDHTTVLHGVRKVKNTPKQLEIAERELAYIIKAIRDREQNNAKA